MANNLIDASNSSLRSDVLTDDPRANAKEIMKLVNASLGVKETRVVDPDTGGEKGSKLARMDLIPVKPLTELAEHFGKGCKKYSPRNWERGYDWSLSYAAAMRHLTQFWGGEDLDAETQSKHVIAAAWHCLALAEFMETMRSKDDRPTTQQSLALRQSPADLTP